MGALVFLTCRHCGAPLTRPVSWAPESAYDPQRANPPERPGSWVPPGSLIRFAKADVVPVSRRGEVIGSHEHSPAGALALNPVDVIAEQWRSIPERDGGCCGSDGCDGPNRRCLCGAVLATERSDCWTPAEVRFLPTAVEVQDG